MAAGPGQAGSLYGSAMAHTMSGKPVQLSGASFSDGRFSHFPHRLYTYM